MELCTGGLLSGALRGHTISVGVFAPRPAVGGFSSGDGMRMLRIPAYRKTNHA
jgi:hypothetical protein